MHIEKILRKLTRMFFALVVGFMITALQSGAEILFPLPWTPWSWTTTAITGDEALQLHTNIAETLKLQDVMSGPDHWDTVTWTSSYGFGFMNLEFTYAQHESRQSTTRGINQSPDSRTGLITEYGLPLRCFIDVDIAFIELPPSSQQNLGGMVMSYSSAMPIPYWTNVAFFTPVAYFLIGFLLALPRKIREAYRVKHGRCRACGYPRGASPVCSECGRAVP